MGLLILIYPIAEIFAWIKFIELYSFLDVLYLLLTGGLVGSIIMTLQGRAALMSLLNSFQNAAQGKSPANLIFHRALIWIGGLFIFLPGIISKIVGTALVLPGTRHLILLYIKSTIIAKLSSGAFRVFTAGGFPGGFPGGPTGGFPENNNTGFPTDARDVYDVTPSQVEHKNKNSEE